MRPQSLLCVAVALGALAAARPATADTPPADTICPRAVPKVVAFNEAATSKDVAKITAAARSAAEAYQLCASDAQVAKGVAVEPTVNYDKTRAAQFMVVEGRALAATGNATDAVAVLKNARHLADDVFGWQPESQTWHASSTGGGPSNSDDAGPSSGGNSAARNADRNGSRYREAAKAIRSAADDELAKLGAPAAAPAKPN
ncbi:MAG TPA: hypothetical protein VGX96_13345 [Candidatus Elarobacter sp.]|jgi:hypothetical protein|nr:hypothetical protein [Candidatus Elarobacter sp.]